jgi:hypothetical protein
MTENANLSEPEGLFVARLLALTQPWTTSLVEGQNSRLKMLKRTMYGRAGFELLRARVLHAAYTPSTESAGEPNSHER